MNRRRLRMNGRRLRVNRGRAWVSGHGGDSGVPLLVRIGVHGVGTSWCIANARIAIVLLSIGNARRLVLRSIDNSCGLILILTLLHVLILRSVGSALLGLGIIRDGGHDGEWTRRVDSTS